MPLASLEQNRTVWSLSPEELGLSPGELDVEQKWIQRFNDVADELNWSKWQEYWADDAFLVFGHKVRIEGREALTRHFDTYLKLFKSSRHELTRHSFDLTQGLIYQTAKVTSIINGDPTAKPIATPIITIIHKRVGESKLRGLEMYGDLSEVEDAIKQVMMSPS
ncbi:SnoaL-like domain protein [Ceratobasidium sp. AG-Ba]|nr:SnoaL-like domain protein [Ceratobasidium sp. AG-Ba]QRW02875.1 SnoaL-like domain protein [Ceratobasidium sp. AG-Ba]